jgi:hypothetical protein
MGASGTRAPATRGGGRSPCGLGFWSG